MNAIQKGIIKLFNIPLNRDVVYPVKEEDIKSSKLFQTVVKELRSRDAQIAEYQIKEKKQKEQNKEEVIEQKIAADLKEQEKILEKEDLGRLFDLGIFYKKLYGVSTKASDFSVRSKWGKKFEIADKNDEVSWKFGKLLISTKGFFVVKDSEGNIRNISYDLKRLIHQPKTIFNQIKRGRLLMANDKNGKYIPELDDEEIPVMLHNREKSEEAGEESYEESEERVESIRNQLIEDKEKLKSAKDKIESLEIIIGDLKIKLEDAIRSNKILMANNNNGKTLVSEAMDQSLQMMMIAGDTQKKITNLMTMKTILETEVSLLEKNLENALKKLEQTGDKTEFEKAKALVDDSLDKIKAMVLSIAPIAPQQNKEQKLIPSGQNKV